MTQFQRGFWNSGILPAQGPTYSGSLSLIPNRIRMHEIVCIDCAPLKF